MKTILSVLAICTVICLASSCSKNDNHGLQNPVSACDTPSVYNPFTSSSGANVEWHKVTGAVSYTLQYRLAGSNVWDSVSVPQPQDSVIIYPLSGLGSNTNYQWRVRTICASGGSTYTSIYYFTTANYIYATYQGVAHTFFYTSELYDYNYGVGNANNYTVLRGFTDSTGADNITLFQLGIGSSTASFACDPSQVNNVLTLVIGSNSYTNTINSSGSETRTIVNSKSCTMTFNATVYNTQNPSDSIVITNGSYSGACLIQ
jgi:hypothetical protein